MPKHAGGRPAKLTEEMTKRIVEGISLGMTDEAVANLIGIEHSTLFRWKQKPKFAAAIKTATRQLVRLRRIENAAPGWQSAC
jgi:DNA invertase Pin-like site-specific DNA recombinase